MKEDKDVKYSDSNAENMRNDSNVYKIIEEEESFELIEEKDRVKLKSNAKRTITTRKSETKITRESETKPRKIIDVFFNFIKIINDFIKNISHLLNVVIFIFALIIIFWSSCFPE